VTGAVLERPGGFVHEAFGYRGEEEFLDGVVGFVRDGLTRDETVVVAEPRPRLDQLRAALGEDAGAVEFLDMADIGGNPGRIIAAWTDALERTTRAGRTLRGVGEPAYAGRSPAELAECDLHELLLDVAFDGGPAWRLMCPYDQQSLPPSVCTQALATHPYRTGPGGPVPTGGARADAAARAFTVPLPPPTDAVLRGEFGPGEVRTVRRTVASWARSCGIPAATAQILELAASELATNSTTHGDGHGVLALWTEPGAAVVEVTDGGSIPDPMVGRRLPPPGHRGGRGLYVVHQLCDLVQVRSSPAGTTVRITTWL
jgi:anti-sigma regulatory factor (Ser/Thr protein kinase)